MTIKLTDRFLTSRKAPTAGRSVYTDSVIPGLTFRVSAATVSHPEGRRDWLLRYRPRRQPQRAVALGTYPAVSLSKARERAAEIVAAANRGVDLILLEDRNAEARRSVEAKAQPLCETAKAYLETVKRLKSWPSIESRTRCHIIPKFGDKPLGEITRADVVEFLDGLERHQGLRHQVNRCLETLRLIFAFAIERELISVNPAVGVSKRKVEIPRDRALSSDELATFWRAIDDLPQLPRAYFRTLLLTGGRRDEVRGMAWSEVDLDAALWRLPAERNKSGRPFEVPLPIQVVETVRMLPRLGPLVFTLDGPRAMTVRGWFDRLRQTTGLMDVRLHDLRRTVRTGLAKLGIPFEIAERVLNHAMPGLQAVYNVHTYSAEKRRALQLWAEHVHAIAEKGEAKVVALQSAAA